MMHTHGLRAAGMQFAQIAHDARPREACGFIVNERGHARIVVMRNYANAPGMFEMRPDDVASILARAEVLALVHSHVGEDCQPSEADVAMMEALDLPSVIVSADTGDVEVFYPAGFVQPLLGREWQYGVADCYTLLRDVFRARTGTALKDFAREDYGAAWAMLDKYWNEAGFVDVGLDAPYRHLDVVLFQFARSTPDHCGIIVEPGELWHHAEGRLSTRETFSHIWRRHALRHLRHASQGGAK